MYQSLSTVTAFTSPWTWDALLFVHELDSKSESWLNMVWSTHIIQTVLWLSNILGYSTECGINQSRGHRHWSPFDNAVKSRLVTPLFFLVAMEGVMEPHVLSTFTLTLNGVLFSQWTGMHSHFINCSLSTGCCIFMILMMKCFYELNFLLQEKKGKC